MYHWVNDSCFYIRDKNSLINVSQANLLFFFNIRDIFTRMNCLGTVLIENIGFFAFIPDGSEVSVNFILKHGFIEH